MLLLSRGAAILSPVGESLGHRSNKEFSSATVSGGPQRRYLLPIHGAVDVLRPADDEGGAEAPASRLAVLKLNKNQSFLNSEVFLDFWMYLPSADDHCPVKPGVSSKREKFENEITEKGKENGDWRRRRDWKFLLQSKGRCVAPGGGYERKILK